MICDMIDECKELKDSKYIEQAQFESLSRFFNRFFNLESQIITQQQLRHELTRCLFRTTHYNEIHMILKSKPKALLIAERTIENFIKNFYTLLWIPRCEKVKTWETTNNISKRDIRRKPVVRVKYEKEQFNIIDGEKYDKKNRKILSRKDQWSIALENSLRYMTKHIEQGGKEAWFKGNGSKIKKVESTFIANKLQVVQNNILTQG